MSNFKNLFNKIAPQYSPEEMEDLSEPSIMDEYIKQNDPEQYEQIQNTKNIKSAVEMGAGSGGAMGTLRKVAKNPQIEKIVMDKLQKASDEFAPSTSFTNPHLVENLKDPEYAERLRKNVQLMKKEGIDYDPHLDPSYLKDSRSEYGELLQQLMKAKQEK